MPGTDQSYLRTSLTKLTQVWDTLKPSMQAIVEALRVHWFDNRAAEGPPWSKVYEEFKAKLPEGHLNKLKELILHGAVPVYLGSK